jgi:ABC-type transport system involved in multi-copper enzyme maturation permease subunit
MSYFYFIWKSHRSFLLFSMIIIPLLQFLILRLVTAIDHSSIIMYLIEQLPENVQAKFGNFTSMLTVEGAAAFGLNHPLVLVILSIGAITIPSRHIAGEAETGTLELVLSFPVKRIKLLMNLWTSAAVFLFLIIFCALCSSLLSINIFKIGCNLWLLFVFIMSLTMVLSSFEKEGNKVGIRVAGIALVFYLLHYLSSLWNAIQFTKPFNIFTYYQPEDLMTGQRSFLLHFMVLSSLILLCLLVSIYQFNRRDIPG